MAKKHTKILKLTGKSCRLGKVSNNLERHGEDYVTGFTIPVAELMLTKAELNAFLRDPNAHMAWFTPQTKTQAAEPRPWWGGEEFHVGESYEADKAMLTLNGDLDLEFESEGDPKEEDYRPALVISKIRLTPQVGGMVELNCSIYVRPGIGKTNLALQNAQHHEVKLTVAAKVTERDAKQPQLPLTEGGTEAAPVGDGDAGESAAPSTH